MNAIRDLLRRKPEAFCERIICLYRPGDDPGWWHRLEDDERLLFAPLGRVLEASTDDVAKEAKDAVSNGLRPLFFVPEAAKWPDVLEAMGHYQSFGSLYVYGRDDETMRELLHGPSVEVLETYAGEGIILVPDLAYGKALDRLLKADLADFERDEAGDRADWWCPRFALVSRLNAFRGLEFEVDCLSGRAALEQFYDSGNGPSARPPDREPCSLPISFLDRRLQFEQGRCSLGETQRELIDRMLGQHAIPR